MSHVSMERQGKEILLKPIAVETSVGFVVFFFFNIL